MPSDLIASRSHGTDTPAVKKRMNHHEHHLAVVRAAKTRLVGMFLSMRLLDAVAFFGTRIFKESKLLCALGLLSLWTTPFLVAIWKRQAWALYLFAAFVFAGVLAGSLGAIHLVSDESNHLSELASLIATAIGYVVIACILLCSKDVKRLISRAYN